jgi:hypothetical protein
MVWSLYTANGGADHCKLGCFCLRPDTLDSENMNVLNFKVVNIKNFPALDAR